MAVVEVPGGVDDLISSLEALQAEMRREHMARAAELARVHPSHRPGAANLIDYLVLRRHDIRPIQLALADLGLSSLGRAEEHVLVSVERVLAMLYLVAGRCDLRRTEAATGFGAGRRAVEAHADALLGPNRPGRSTRILVTMPTEAADDASLVRALIEQGMGSARINCAHDDPARWERMIGNIRRAAEEFGCECPVLMDLPGAKLRTGPIEPGPRVLRLRPHRDALGRPLRPAVAHLVGLEADVAAGSQGSFTPARAIPVDRTWMAGLHVGDEIRLRDARHARRKLRVVQVEPESAAVEVWDTTYLVSGADLCDARGRRTMVGPLPAQEQALELHVGDIVTMTADMAPAAVDPDGKRFRIGCSLAAAFGALDVGQRVLFDDGKIGGAVIAVRRDEVDVQVTEAGPSGTKLRADKGVNLPDSRLDIPSFDSEDEKLLRFIADHADLVGLSFVQHVEDVRFVQDRLSDHPRSPGLVLKVETARGFTALPELLLAAMESEGVGVMVARGDLAVECGFERLAELQEEILWLCDAAHVPVIWATQVLDQMARSGQPSRAEVSDAVMGGRSECV
ncbi:MAG TPA: pyruvate kinase, partial [Acidimicrobiales bacterium]|nr:pyruvate kinase [Acidimicrobiales bacterium]